MKRSQKGFTLIELLVVVAIIGILAAIAIPQFQQYRERAFDGRAQSDLRNMMTAQEAHFTDNEEYANAEADLTDFGFKKSDGVTVAVAGDASRWDGSTSHASGGKTYCYASDSATSNGIVPVDGVGAACP